MLTVDSILPYVLSCPLRIRAQGDILRFGMEMSPVRTPVGTQDHTRAEEVPRVQEPVLEQGKGPTSAFEEVRWLAEDRLGGRTACVSSPNKQF
jgi:hypothetical protein